MNLNLTVPLRIDLDGKPDPAPGSALHAAMLEDAVEAVKAALANAQGNGFRHTLDDASIAVDLEGITASNPAQTLPPAGEGCRFQAAFEPQAWINDNAVPVDAEGPAEWDCTAFVRSPENADCFTDGAVAEIVAGDGGWVDNDDRLKADTAAPEWVREWQGPFTITVRAVRPADDEDLVCDECGRPMVINDDGTTNHIFTEKPEGTIDDIDYDTDADHVALNAEHEDAPVVHLTYPRGSIVCGASAGQTTADINFVSCEICLRKHDHETGATP